MRKSIDKLKDVKPDKLIYFLEQSYKELERFETAFDSLSSVLILFNTKGVVSFANKFAKTFFNQDLVGKKMTQLFPESHCVKKIYGIIDNDVQEEIKGELFEFQCMRTQNQLVLLVTLFPHIVDGKISGWILFFQDHTERIYRQQMQSRNTQLNSISQISSSIAHEIKNPLGAISIHLQLIEKNLQKLDPNSDSESIAGLKKKICKYVDVIGEEIENLNNVVVLFLNNLNVKPSDMKPCSVNEMLISFLNFVQPDLDKRKIKIQVELDKTDPYISASKSSIVHVLLNIVKNAMEEMDEGGSLKIKTYTDKNRVFITLADTGRGISDEMLGSIFSPYITSKEHGTGIGLAISDKIMQIHRGSISVDTKYTDGACFVLDFPCSADEQHLLIAPEVMTM